MRRPATRRRRAAVILGGLCLALAVARPSAAQDVRVEVGFHSEVAGVDDVVPFTIRVVTFFNGEVNIRPEFRLDNLELADPRPNLSRRMVNSGLRTMQTLEITYSLQPRAPGLARIRDIRLQVSTEKGSVRSQTTYRVAGDRRLRIVKGRLLERYSGDRDSRDRTRHSDASRPPRPSAWPVDRDPEPETRPPDIPGLTPYWALRDRLIPENPYVGQPVTYVVELIHGTSVKQVGVHALPTFEGFWAEGDLDQQTGNTEEFEDGGRLLGRTRLIERSLVPRRAGTFEIDPTILNLTVDVPTQNWFGPSLREETLRRSTAPRAVTVRELPPLPDGAPPFTGAVGRVELEATLSREAVDENEAATLTLRMTGDAHLNSLPDPPPPASPGVEIYPPETSVDTDWKPGGVERERTWSYTLAPRGAGRFRIAPVSMSWFDPEAGRYRTATTQPLELLVRPIEGATSRTLASTGALHPIRSSLGAEAATGGGWGSRWASWLLWLTVIPAALVLWLRAGRDARADGDPDSPDPLVRTRAVAAGLAEDDLGDRRAARRLEDAWRDLLESRWGVPAATPARRWTENLASRREVMPDGRLWTDAVLMELDALVEDLSFLARAPELSDTRVLRRELDDHTRRLLSRLT